MGTGTDWGEGLPDATAAELAAAAERVAEPLHRLDAVMAERGTGPGRYPRWTETTTWPADVVRDALLGYHLRVCRGTWSPVENDEIAVRDLAGRYAGWTEGDLRFALRTAATAASPRLGDTTHLEMPIGIAVRMGPDGVGDLRPILVRVLAWLEVNAGVASRSVLLRTLATLLEPDAALPRWLLTNGDAFGPAVRRDCAEDLTGPGVGALLAHCAEADRPVPARRWFAELRQRLRDAPTGRDVARSIMEHFTRAPLYLHADNDRLLRGIVLTLPDDDVDMSIRVTFAACATGPRQTGFPYAPQTAATAVIRLGQSDRDESLRTLARLSTTVGNRGLAGRVQTALAELAARRGCPPSQVLEFSVPDHGLGATGVLTREVGEHLAAVRINGTRARVAFSRDGQTLSSVPAAVKEHHPDALKELKDLVRAVDATLVAERGRIEALLAEEREWSSVDWSERMLDHPVTRTYGRRLIYETTVDGREWAAGWPEHTKAGWVLVGPDGTALEGARIRLWHPVRAAEAEVDAWREHVMVADRHQPLKQAFREIYRLTPAEEQTGTYSNRFAAHILRYRQANALMRTRGWQAPFLGPWEGGFSATATKEFGRWRASFRHDLVHEAGLAEARLCSTDQVRFEQAAGAGWDSAPVASVPAVVLSEAMRDVDLFVGVTSIATDAEWVDRGENRYIDYWQRTAFGELTAAAELRRDVLARLLPKTKIADRVQLEQRFLRVRGSLRTYRIHLGSGNIRMEPNDAYLCIVAAPGRMPALHLPFEDDELLSVILSRAFLLAADDAITDPAILDQLRAR